MKFNIKSKKGFTLIELLVVIGILAVLAAIAIPSVAGLIDRTNVSADKTNANEYTNAIERFTSEYELYCQDIASGAIKDADGDGKPDGLDSAQSRVYNVTGAVSRADITALENEIGLNNIKINKDTKYPSNATTLQKVIQNYTKTSSSTFEPKQSDMHYWYSPDCGIVVFAEPNAITDKMNKLNAQVISGKDAKGNILSETTIWIDLTSNATINLSDGHNEIIPEGGEFIGIDGNKLIGDGFSVMFPQNLKIGDIYLYGDYEYRYGLHASETSWIQSNQYDAQYGIGWGVKVIDKTQKNYGEIISNICNKPVVSLSNTFFNCKNLMDLSTIIIPNTVKTMDFAFRGCEQLTSIKNLKLPNNLISLSGTFYWLHRLNDIHELQIPNSVKYMTSTFVENHAATLPPTLPSNLEEANNCFSGCRNMQTVPELPSNIKSSVSMFNNCKNATGDIVINCNPANYNGMFYGVDFLSQSIKLKGNSTVLDEIGRTGINYCTECNGKCNNSH